MGEGHEMILVTGKTIGGLRQAELKRVEADSPVIYLVVDGIDSATNKASELGAEIVGEKVVINENDGLFQWVRDHDKNLISLWATK